MHVSATTQEFKDGVGVTQAVDRTVLPILVLKQARVKHQMTKSAVQPVLLLAITEVEKHAGMLTASICNWLGHYDGLQELWGLR